MGGLKFVEHRRGSSGHENELRGPETMLVGARNQGTRRNPKSNPGDASDVRDCEDTTYV
jgi:hypothetical protein